MQNKIAKILSIILHPSLMPLIGVIIIFNSGTYLSYNHWRLIIILIVLIGTLLLPLLFLPFFLYRNLIKSFEMGTLKERILPFFLGFLFYSCTYLYLSKENLPIFIKEFILASTIAVLLIFFISFKWKISAHMVGIGGIIGLISALIIRLSADVQIFFISFIILGGLLGTARLKLEAHTPAQVYTGFALGFITVLLTLLMY